MKKMTCRQMKGGCDKEYQGENFAEIQIQHEKHLQEMAQKGDADHYDSIDAMNEMRDNPEALDAFYKNREGEYNNRFDME